MINHYKENSRGAQQRRAGRYPACGCFSTCTDTLVSITQVSSMHRFLSGLSPGSDSVKSLKKPTSAIGTTPGANPRDSGTLARICNDAGVNCDAFLPRIHGTGHVAAVAPAQAFLRKPCHVLHRLGGFLGAPLQVGLVRAGCRHSVGLGEASITLRSAGARWRWVGLVRALCSGTGPSRRERLTRRLPWSNGAQMGGGVFTNTAEAVPAAAAVASEPTSAQCG